VRKPNLGCTNGDMYMGKLVWENTEIKVIQKQNSKCTTFFYDL